MKVLMLAARILALVLLAAASPAGAQNAPVEVRRRTSDHDRHSAKCDNIRACTIKLLVVVAKGQRVWLRGNDPED
jgi:hypothetical protein